MYIYVFRDGVGFCFGFGKRLLRRAIAHVLENRSVNISLTELQITVKSFSFVLKCKPGIRIEMEAARLFVSGFQVAQDANFYIRIDNVCLICMRIAAHAQPRHGVYISSQSLG